LLETLNALHRFYTSSVETNWEYIVPSAFLLGAIVWLLTVYRKGSFRWLPAWAIARVTVLDSVGRLEVIFLLIIGMLLVGVFGFNLFWSQSRNLILDQTVIQTYFDNRLGNTGFTLTKPEQELVLADILGTAAMFFGEFFIAIIGFVLAMFVLPNEINRGVVLSILPKPLTRAEYVFGKLLGTWIIVTGCFLVISIELYIIEYFWFAIHQGYSYDEGFRVWFKMGLHYPLNMYLIRAMFLFPIKYATLVLLIMWLSLRMPEAPAGIIGLSIFIVGHFSDRIYEMSRELMHPNPLFAWVFKGCYWMLPHLTEALSLTILDIDATNLGDSGVLWGWIWQIVVYNTILLWLLILFFRRRSY